MDLDWQNSLTEIKDRGQYLLHSEKWADCRFLVGTPPNQRLIAGHKLLLAMASPVFERMFFGNLPDKGDPIAIPDVQPMAFEAMLEYIYTDRITIASFDKACELCYVAKKYMLPHVVTRCTHFLWADLSPKNACRAYEFAKLFDEPRLMQSSMDLIAANTREVLSDASFVDIEVSTLMAILDQNRLNIDSELDLFNCLLKFASERGILYENSTEDGAGDKDAASRGVADDANVSNEIMVEEIKMEPDVAAMVQHMHQDDDVENFEHVGEQPAQTSASAAMQPRSVSVNAVVDDVVIIDSDASGNANDDLTATEEANMMNIMVAQRTIMDSAMLRQAVKKIRFLTMTPQQFAEGPARSKLLQQHEALAILIKISSPTLNDCNMPEGFCTSRSTRNFYESAHRQRELSSSYRHTVGISAPTSNVCFPGSAGRCSGISLCTTMPNQQAPFGRTAPFGSNAVVQRPSAPLNLRTNMEANAAPIPGFFDDNDLVNVRLPPPQAVNVSANVLQRGPEDDRVPGANGNASLRSFDVTYDASVLANVSAAAVGAGDGSTANSSHQEMVRSYCVRALNRQSDYFRNTSVTDCGVTFQVDTNIWILGVQVPTQVLCDELMHAAGFTDRYTELLYAHIQNMHGSRITYTHCTARVRYDSMLDITFDRPVYIYRNQLYKIFVVFNKGGGYPIYNCVPDAICHDVKFMFNVGNPIESVRDGLIYAIIFSTPQDHARHMID